MPRIPALILFLIFSAFAGFAQVDGRIIHFEPTGQEAEATLEITDLFVGSRRIYFNEVFANDENWLNELRMAAKLPTDKELVRVELQVGLRNGLDNDEVSGSWTTGRKISATLTTTIRYGVVVRRRSLGSTLKLEFEDPDLPIRNGRSQVPAVSQRKSPDDGKYNQIRIFGAKAVDANGQEFELKVIAPSLIRKKEPTESQND